MVIVILAVAIIISGLSMYKKSKLKKGLSDARLKSEMLLSEKLNLDKCIAKFKNDLDEIKNKNAYLNNSISEANLEILAKKREIDKLVAKNASIKMLKKKNEELEELLKTLNMKITALNKSIAQANIDNKKLNDQLTSSSKTNSNLSSNNTVLKGIKSDNYRTEALRGKNKRLTISAIRTNRLMVSFDLPGNITDDIYFRVVTPQGKEFSSNNALATTIQIIKSGDGLLASSSTAIIESDGTKRIEMTYEPNQKLSKGIYQFNIFNGERFLGSTQIRLK